PRSRPPSHLPVLLATDAAAPHLSTLSLHDALPISRTILKPKSSDVIHVAERHYCGPVLERPALKESHQLVALGNDISYSLTVPTDLGLVGVGRSTRSDVAVETFPDRGHVNPICIARKPATLIVRSPNSHSSLLGSAAYASNTRLGKTMGLLLFCAFHKVGL